MKWFSPVLGALKTKVSGLIRVIKSDGLSAGNRYISQDVGNVALSAVVKQLYRNVGVVHANRVYADLRQQAAQKRFGFNAQWSREVEQYLNKFLLEKITFEVNSTTRDKLLRVLVEANQKGWSVDQTVEALQGLSKENGWLRYQTARIVRTEVKRAGEVGGKVASDEFEYEQDKVWVAIKDIRTRGRSPKDHADHYRMDGQTVASDAMFEDPRNGHRLSFPGDPVGAAEDVINCRCTAAYVVRRDENGRLIPKKRTPSRVSVIRPGEFVRQREIVTV